MSSTLYEECWGALSPGNKLQGDTVFTATSFTYNKNNNGPNIDPWDTPVDSFYLYNKRSRYVYITFRDLWHR